VPNLLLQKNADSKHVCNLPIKRIPDNVIIKVYERTSKTISKVALLNTRKKVKRDSYQGYKNYAKANTNTYTNPKNELMKYIDESKISRAFL
jgi:hypothetical protein